MLELEMIEVNMFRMKQPDMTRYFLQQPRSCRGTFSTVSLRLGFDEDAQAMEITNAKSISES